MKTYRIEVQRFAGMGSGHGLVNVQLEASVLPQRAGDEGAPLTVLSMSEASARTLQQLLKAQFAQIDARKARSQR